MRLLLVPKANLAPAADGSRPSWDPIPGESRSPTVPTPATYLPLEGDGGRAHHASSRLVWSAAVCCAALGLAAVVTPFIRQELALASLEEQIAAGRTAAAEADSLRQEIDRLAGSADFVESERDKAGPAARWSWRLRPTVLPDDTYLTEMELRQRKVTLSGRSAAAARLIGPLAADGTFRNPGFAAPVTRLEALRCGALHDQRGGRAIVSLAAMPTGRSGRLWALILLLIALASVYLLVVIPLVDLYAERRVGPGEPTHAAASAEGRRGGVARAARAGLRIACRGGRTEGHPGGRQRRHCFGQSAKPHRGTRRLRRRYDQQHRKPSG